MEKETGQANFAARARLIIHLGNQLITDEVAAISELIKNSYDADALEVIIEINNVSQKDTGYVKITDNGNGMTRQTILESWLELGTISKARKEDEPPRLSEVLKRAYLGEKGLGRLSIHKIGKQTEIASRKRDTDSETKIILDWNLFEDSAKYLGDVKINWEEDIPHIFRKDVEPKFEHGTQIYITNLHRVWTKDMIKKIRYFVESLNSPFSSLSNFKVTLKVNDPLDEEIAVKKDKIKEIFDTAHYTFSAEVDENGIADMKFSYKSKLFSQFNTEKEKVIPKYNLKEPEAFPAGKKPICGPFRFYIYCWDLDPKDKESTFDENVSYDTMVKPLTGIKLFRDGFRVLPYGNQDNDWLSMDKKRIGQFAEKVSRGQVIGYVEISSETCPKLIDKSDREGLINNDAFRDFEALVNTALTQFEAERWAIREKIKQVKRGDARIKQLSKQMNELMELLINENVRSEVRTQITQIIEKTNKTFTKILEEAETPLIVAASLGLSYMIPTHEAHRNVQESEKMLKRMIEKHEPNMISKIKMVIEYLNQTDTILSGVVKLSQKVREQENFQLKIPADLAVNLLRQKFKRENIEISTDYRSSKIITGSQRLISVAVLNMLDNSIYWLGTKSNNDRKIKVTITNFENQHALVISDNGPGFQDTIEFLTMPFITRKSKGMGLGLYICKRIAEMHGAKLEILDEGDVPGLLSGANIALLFPLVESR